MNKKVNIKVLLLTLLCFFSLQPWITWQINTKITFFIGLSYILYSINNFKLRYYKSLLIIIIIIYFLFLNTLVNANLWRMLACAIIFLFIYINETDEIKLKTFLKIRSIIAYVYLIGIPIFLIISFTNIIHPIGIIQGRSISIPAYYNFIFYIKNVYSEPLILSRFNSIFDEPGVVGNLSFFLLLFNSFKLNNWKYIVILIGGLLSFSLFFYVASISCLILLNLKTLKDLIYFVSLMIFLGYLLNNNEYVNNYLIDRLQIINGKLSGDNRTTEIWDIQYKKYLQSNKIYFGAGDSSYKKYQDLYGYDVASYQLLVYKYGVIGFFIFLIFFLMIFYHKNNKSISLIAFIAFLMAIYQRPWEFEYYYSIIFLSGIVHLKNIKGNTNNNSI